MGTQRIHTGLSSYVRSLESMIESTSNEALCGRDLSPCGKLWHRQGDGIRALRWDGGALVGINNPDAITFRDLTGLAHQKEVLIENTERFVSGYHANDVLLTGSSGTGKSSSVKACLNLFKDRGLRLIELSKSQLADLPAVFRAIKNRCSAISFLLTICPLRRMIPAISC